VLRTRTRRTDWLANCASVWVVQEEAVRKNRQARLQQDFKEAEEAKARKEAMRKETGLPGSSS
jgi:hypothetical protein